MTQRLFNGGRVFDGRGAMLEEHGVLVDDERFVRVAPAGEFEGFAGEVVDTAGGTLIPGLIDCHVHLCLNSTADPLASLAKMAPGEIALAALGHAITSLRGGITAVRDCGGKDYLEFPARDACNAGVFQGPTIRAAGRLICMTGGHGHQWGRVADGCDEVMKAVREQVHAGADLVKIMATGGVMTRGVNPEDAHYSAEEMRAGVAEAKRFHKRTASHAQGTEGILNAVRAGIDSVEHGIFMSEKCVHEMVEAGTYLVPTIAALKNITAHADKGIPDYVVEKAARVSERHKESIAMFHRAGGKIAMGTDAGTPFNYHGENARELAYMVEYGLAPAEALLAATANAAELMGLGDHGAIAEGFVADAIVVSGDPLADIACAADTANHRAVYRRGKLVS